MFNEMMIFVDYLFDLIKPTRLLYIAIGLHISLNINSISIFLCFIL